MKTFFKLTKHSGFSLMEILIALTLLGLGGTFVAGKIFDRLQEGRVSSTKIQMNQLAELLKDFKRKCGFYPTTEQGFEALVSKPSGRECKDYPPNGFVESGSVGKDGWDTDLIYESDGTTYNICSNGADQVQGGEGFDADFCLNDKKSSSSTGGGASQESAQ